MYLLTIHVSNNVTINVYINVSVNIFICVYVPENYHEVSHEPHTHYLLDYLVLRDDDGLDLHQL